MNKLKEYATKIEMCGEFRNSYSKTDRDATFMRAKTDYNDMNIVKNNQLISSYNIQVGICGEYITVIDTYQYATDCDCFIPLMGKFKS